MTQLTIVQIEGNSGESIVLFDEAGLEKHNPKDFCGRGDSVVATIIVEVQFIDQGSISGLPLNRSLEVTY